MHKIEAINNIHSYESNEIKALSEKLIEDLKNGCLALAFQRVVAFDRINVISCLYYEVLLRRSVDFEVNYLSCGEGIKALELMNKVEQLDFSVIWTTIHTLKLNTLQKIGCNISALTFKKSSNWNFIIFFLEKNKSISERLFIEITETSEFSDKNESLILIKRLKNTGVKIVIDDYGKYNSNTELIELINPDVVKIDRSLLAKSRDSILLLKKVIESCHRVTDCVIVEGVESELDLKIAHNAGAQGVQGFYIHRPTLRTEWISKSIVKVTNIFV